MKQELRGSNGGRRRWELSPCSHTAAQGIYSGFSKPSEYRLFMCSLILHMAQRLMAAGMTCLHRGKEGPVHLSLNVSTVGRTKYHVL